MKWIVSRYNQDIEWIKEYTNDIVLYDRSETPLDGAIVVPNIGSDLHDKFTYIIDNYDNLPDVFVLTKANLFKYISKEEFDTVKDNKVFTPLLTQHHKVYEPICRYVGGIYEEINNYWYLDVHKAKYTQELIDLLGIQGMSYLQFAPGSNYIVTKECVRKHPKEFYEKLRGYMEWDRYPGEAQMIERSLYFLWKP